MSAIFSKLACYGSVLMEGQELLAYFNFLKQELRNTVRGKFRSNKTQNYI